MLNKVLKSCEKIISADVKVNVKQEMGYSRKKNRVVEDFFEKQKETPGIFRIFILPLEIPGKTKLHPWKFYKIVLDPLENPRRSKTKTPGNSISFFLD